MKSLIPVWRRAQGWCRAYRSWYHTKEVGCRTRVVHGLMLWEHRKRCAHARIRSSRLGVAYISRRQAYTEAYRHWFYAKKAWYHDRQEEYRIWRYSRKMQALRRRALKDTPAWLQWYRARKEAHQSWNRTRAMSHLINEPTGRRRTLESPLLVAGMILVAGGVLIAGSWEQYDYPSDAAYLEDTDTNIPNKRELDPRTLLAWQPGAHWTLSSDHIHRNSTRDQWVSSTRKMGQETLAVLANRVDGERTGDCIYRIGSEGVSLVGLGEAGSIQLAPALPLLRTSTHVGAVTYWRGNLQVPVQHDVVKVPAQVYVRLDGPDPLQTERGVQSGYRMDMTLTTAKGLLQHSIVWYIPNVGIARIHDGLDGDIIDYSLEQHQISASAKSPTDTVIQ